MRNPIPSQINKRHQFSTGRENIKIRQQTIPAIGTKGDQGARKGRSACGWVLRMISTAAQTITNASKVPMFVNSASIRSGSNVAIAPTKTPVRIVDFHGVRNFECTAPKKLSGTMPSRAMPGELSVD